MNYVLIIVLLLSSQLYRENEPEPPLPIKDRPIKEQLKIYDSIQQINKLIREIHPEFGDQVTAQTELLKAINISRDDMNHLIYVHELHQQVELEMTMSKVLEIDREPTEIISNGRSDPLGLKARVIENQKYLYEVGYEFKMQEAANGNLESYVVKDRQSLWGKAVYLVKNPHEEDIMMQESQITNWKREE